MILKTEGIVLKTFDLRETSRIAIFFTKEYGKVGGVLKGIRKDHKKFGSSVDRFSVNDIVYYQYRNSDLHLISHCDLKSYYYPIRQDLKKSLAASYILELVNLIMPSEEKNVKIYRLMLDFLESLQSVESRDSSLLVHFFQIKVLSLSGFKPHLDTCLKCKKTIIEKARFSLREGGLVCWDCAAGDSTLELLSPGAVSSIIYAESHEWPICLRLKLTESVQKELKYVLNNFLVFHLGRKIKSAKYLR
ncbi:MAG: DNA repair protein RecO [Candidatus Omnitrophica bacterium]|nr:DNA repair protein RecO [Candidatus Omnitrophota bacterium]